MFRVALRNVLALKARLVMTVLAVLLGVAFVSATLVFTTTIANAYTNASQSGFDHLDVQIRASVTEDTAGTGRLLDQALLERTRALPGVGSATGAVSGFAALAGRDGHLVGAGWRTTGANYDGTHGRDPRYPMTAGRPPRTSGEIAIDVRTAGRTRYGVGDTVRTSISGPVLTQRITGVFISDDGNVAAGGTLTLFDTATAQKLFATPGHYNLINLTAEPGTSPERLQRQAAAMVPFGVEAVTAARLTDEQAAENAENLTTLSQVLLACAGIALFVGGFLIVNTFTMLVTQRARELALLRAAGATRGQVTRSVLTEAATVGLIASVAGLAAGIGIGAGVRAVLAAGDGTLPDGPLVIDATTVLVSLALGLGVTMFAAWPPARRAAKIPPVTAMSGLHAPATTRSLVMRGSIGAILAAAGGSLVLGATTVAGGSSLLGLGAALLLIGVIVLTPVLCRPLIGAMTPLLRRAGVCGTLAARNALRNPRRTAATASALTIGLTLITSLTVLGASAAATTDALAGSDYLRADYIISMANSGPITPDVERTVGRLDEVIASSPARPARIRVDGMQQTVTGFRTEEIDRLIGLDFVAGSFTSGRGSAVIDQETAAVRGWHLGDTLDVTWPDDAHGTLRISGVYRSAFDDGLKTDVSVIDRHLDRIADTQIFVKTKGGASKSTKRAMEKALGDGPAIRVQDKRDLVADIAGTIGLIVNLLYGMLALTVIVAVIGVVNTLTMSVYERTREIGVLRALGLGRAGVRRMVRLESLVISLFGAVLGVGLGVFLGWAVGELVAAMGVDTWTLTLPWVRLTLFVAVAALVGVVAALWPAHRAAHLTVLVAITTE